MEEKEAPKFNLTETIPPVMAFGTWLFAMYQAYHGIHYVPDEWILSIILSPYSATVYSVVRDKVADALKRLPKKN